MESLIASKISAFLIRDSDLSDKDIVRIEFTVLMLFINLSKVLIFSLLAFITHSFISTCFAYFPFLFLRRYIYGYHAVSSFKCGILTTTHFWLLPFILQNYQLVFQLWQLLLFYIIATLLIMIYGSIGTSTNPVKKEKRGLLKIKAILILSLIFISLLVGILDSMENCVILGVLIAVSNILPITRKIYYNWGN